MQAFETLHDFQSHTPLNHLADFMILYWASDSNQSSTRSTKLTNDVSLVLSDLSGFICPIVFSVYTSTWFYYIKKCVSSHWYADHTQLYLPVKRNDPRGLASLNLCLTDKKCWMSQNFLQLNKSMSEEVWSSQSYCRISGKPLMSGLECKTLKTPYF